MSHYIRWGAGAGRVTCIPQATQTRAVFRYRAVLWYRDMICRAQDISYNTCYAASSELSVQFQALSGWPCRAAPQNGSDAGDFHGVFTEGGGWADPPPPVGLGLLSPPSSRPQKAACVCQRDTPASGKQACSGAVWRLQGLWGHCVWSGLGGG